MGKNIQGSRIIGGPHFPDYNIIGYNGVGGSEKACLPLSNYTTSTTAGVANKIFFIPFKEGAPKIDKLSMTVTTLDATGQVSVALYNAATQSGYGGQVIISPGTYSVLGTFSTSTTGVKTLTNLNYTLPDTQGCTYFFGIQTSSATMALQTWASSVSIFPEWLSGVNLSGTFYRYYTYNYTPGTFGHVNNILFASFSAVTGTENISLTYATKK